MSGWERDEWWADVSRQTEVERELAADEPRRSLGIIGDPEDDL